MKKSILALFLAMTMLVGGCTGNGSINNADNNQGEESNKPKRDIALTIGSKEIDIVEFTYQYKDSISSFYSEYYYLISSLGVDLSGDLTAQYLPTGQSYHDYFVENTINFLAEQKYLVLC